MAVNSPNLVLLPVVIRELDFHNHYEYRSQGGTIRAEILEPILLGDLGLKHHEREGVEILLKDAEAKMFRVFSES